MMMEFFRGTPHESVLSAMVASSLEDDHDPGQDEVEFVATINHLQNSALNREISVLVERARHGLSPDERTRLSALLAKKAAATAASTAALAGNGGFLV